MRDEHTALLVMDVQEEIVARFGDSAVLERFARAAAVARPNGVLVIYVKVAFRPGYPEVSPRNASFSYRREWRFHRDGKPSTSLGCSASWRARGD